MPVFSADLERRLEDGARLHLGDLGVGDDEAAAAVPEHRVELVERPRRARGGSPARPTSPSPPRRSRRPSCGRNSWSGGSSRRIVTGRPSMIVNSSTKSARCIGRSLSSAARRAGLVVGEDHLAHRDDAILLEEHVLGPAEADALGAEGERGPRVGRRLGIGADPHPPRLVGPLHQLAEVAGELRLAHRDDPGEHLAGRAVDGDDVALLEDAAPGGHRARLVVDADRARAGDAGLAHAARHHRGVAGHAAAGGEDALGRVHAVDVLGAGLDADEDHLLSRLLRGLGFLGREDDLARGRARRGGQAARHDVAGGRGIDRRVEELVEGERVDAQQRLVGRDQPLVDHVDGDLERRRPGALGRAGLEHPQPAALDGELDVLDVAIVLLQRLADGGEFPERVGEQRLERRLVGAGGDPRRLGQVLRRAGAGDHVLALGVEQELAVEGLLAGRGVAGEGDAGGRGVAHVAEDHRLDVDRRAPVLRDDCGGGDR